MRNNLALGAQGEELAAQFLIAAGMTIEARNWRCRYGELDIVARCAQSSSARCAQSSSARCAQSSSARPAESIVFVEVKARTGVRFGRPAEAVTAAKQARIRRLAALWLAERNGPWVPIRFDVVEVFLAPGREPVIEHLPGVV